MKKGFILKEPLLPGDRIRAYDYPFSRDHYIEGNIKSVDSLWIEVDCDADTKPGAYMKGTMVLVPVASPMDRAWEGDRIEKLHKK